MNYAGQCYLAALPPHEDVLEILRRRGIMRQLSRLILRDGLKCCWCRRICNIWAQSSCDAFPTREHIVRKADGGSSRMTNLAVACRKCNSSRHSEVNKLANKLKLCRSPHSSPAPTAAVEK